MGKNIIEGGDVFAARDDKKNLKAVEGGEKNDDTKQSAKYHLTDKPGMGLEV